MREVFIVDAKRSAVGNYLGSLSSLEAHQIGAEVVKNILSNRQSVADDLDELISGQVLTGGQGQNPARNTLITSGIDISKPAFTVNKVCGSGLKSVGLGYYSIASGDGNLVLAGGQESMSRSLHGALLRTGTKMGNISMLDMMVYDGLTDVFSGKHMGVTAENLAKKYEISRSEQDDFAFKSNQKASKAKAQGIFKNEIVPIKVKIGKEEVLFDNDEFIKADTSLEKLGKLRPAFDKDGSVTAGNSSGINDGAAFVLLASRDALAKHNLKPMARIVGHASVGVDPNYMGIGPAFAVQKLLKNIGWRLSDLDLVEANEAFAAQAIAVNKILEWNLEKVNVNGGAVAIGHPIGASGCRILVSLIHEMKRRNAKKALATLCIGGGMGIALAIENI